MKRPRYGSVRLGGRGLPPTEFADALAKELQPLPRLGGDDVNFRDAGLLQSLDGGLYRLGGGGVRLADDPDYGRTQGLGEVGDDVLGPQGIHQEQDDGGLDGGLDQDVVEHGDVEELAWRVDALRPIGQGLRLSDVPLPDPQGLQLLCCMRCLFQQRKKCHYTRKRAVCVE